jgi:peroxiredoxin
MRNVLSITAALLLLLLALAFWFREPLKEMAFARLTQDMFVAADNDDFDPGPAVGSHFPGLQATYRGRTITLLNEFAGTNGTLLIVNRSLDSCPYSRRQMIQLQEHRADFDAVGIGMVAITHDNPDAQQVFVDEHHISIPVLSDVNALSMKTVGLLDENFRPDDSRYGSPYPGMMVIDPNGIVVGKLFLEDFRTRVDTAVALAFAKKALGLDSH